MTIISPSAFVGELDIPNTDQQAVAERVQWFIDEYEPIFLKMLMGSVMYAEYLSTIGDSRWDKFKTDVAMPLTRYVYYQYLDDGNTYNSGVGVAKPKTENAAPANAAPKMVKQWNKMCIQVQEVKQYLNEAAGLLLPNVGYDLPDCACDLPFNTGYCTKRPEIFNFKNSLGV